MTTDSLRLPYPALPLIPVLSCSIAIATVLVGTQVGVLLLRSPDAHWVLATTLATLAMVVTTLVVFAAHRRRTAMVAVASQAVLLVSAPILAWLYELNHPGGFGSVVEGLHHRIYSGMPFHLDIPMSVVLGLAPLHLVALTRAIDPGTSRPWLRLPFALALLTLTFTAITSALGVIGTSRQVVLVPYLLAVIAMSITRLSVTACAFVLLAVVLLRRGRRHEAALVAPAALTLGLALLVAPAYRFHLTNLGYRPLSVGLMMASGLGLVAARGRRSSWWPPRPTERRPEAATP